MSQVIFCVDVGGTKTAFAVFTPTGTELAYGRFATEAERGAEDLVARLYEKAAPSLKGADVTCGVVAAPGPLDAEAGVLIDVVTMGWKNVRLTELLSQKFGFAFSLLNDCDAGALGVWRFGGYADCKSLAYVSVSTGIGGGLVIDGRLVTGKGNAANFGHIPVAGKGQTCGCGRKDCVELYASGMGIERVWFEQTGEQATCAQIADMARAGNRRANAVFMRAGTLLAQAMSAVRAVIDPEKIVFGGSVTKAGDLLFPPFIRAFGENPIVYKDEDGKQVLYGALAYGLQSM